MWSLGITFFEILIGRTPFEHSDGEQFTTKEDLEKYWARTVCLDPNSILLTMLILHTPTASGEMGRHLENVCWDGEDAAKNDSP